MSSVTQFTVDQLAKDVGQLLEKHDDRPARDFTAYRDDPVGFLRDVLHTDPWPRQVDIAELVRDNPRVVVRSAHNIGKDWLMTRLLAWHVYARDGLAIYTGPTDRQLGIGMRELRSMFRAAPDLHGELYARSLRIAGEDRLMAFTSSNVDNLTGWHDPNGVMVAISEGQGERVEEVAYDAAFALISEEGSRIVVGGNPVRPTGRFFEISRKHNWVAVKIPASEHPNIAAGKRVVPYGPGPNWPAEIEAEYGRESAYYVARVLAEFPETAEDALCTLAWLEAAAARWREVMPDAA